MQPIVLTPAPHRHPAPNPLEKYYAFHAHIYNATRWSFLFGRTHLLQLARQLQPSPTRILEIGCGTGRNLVRLARFFPQAEIIGVDLSTAMLAVARRQTARYRSRITLVEGSYGNARSPVGHYDLVICSYALTMFNPGFQNAVAAAHADLAAGGHFLLVDFHSTPWLWFARWMRFNHVRMDGQLRPLLESTFTPVSNQVRSAYGGLWQFLLFAGKQKSAT